MNNAGQMSVAMFEDVDNITDFHGVMVIQLLLLVFVDILQIYSSLFMFLEQDTDFWGSVYTTRYAVSHLRNSRGKIVAISSVAAWLPQPRQSIYNASKAAVKSFFETLRVELGSDVGITIVTPGFIESEILQGKFVTHDGQLHVDKDARDVTYLYIRQPSRINYMNCCVI